jgi:hypothetical protein
MAHIGWHTEVASLRDRRKIHVPADHDRRRISRARPGVHVVLAHTGANVTAEAGQTDRYECREPWEKHSCRPAEISYGPFRFPRFT